MKNQNTSYSTSYLDEASYNRKICTCNGNAGIGCHKCNPDEWIEIKSGYDVRVFQHRPFFKKNEILPDKMFEL